jgi:hypothetical protein
MPKKSDRANHGTAMSELFPDVSLEESESSEESEASGEESDAPTDTSSESGSSKELQSSSSTALQNQQASTEAHSPAEDEEGSSTSSEESIPTGDSAPSGGSTPSSRGDAHQRREHDSDREDPHQTKESIPVRDAGASPAPFDDPEQPLSVHPRQRPNLGQKLGPYVSDDVDQALEEVYLTLRRRFGGEASKSLIVEAALRYVLSDCLKRGADSELTRWFERVLDKP